MNWYDRLTSKFIYRFAFCVVLSLVFSILFPGLGIGAAGYIDPTTKVVLQLVVDFILALIWPALNKLLR